MSLVADVPVISFGLGDHADVSASAIDAGKASTSFKLQLPNEEVDVRLPLSGVHNVRNACAAAAVAHALNVSIDKIKTALESIAPVSGRLQPIDGLQGATVYDDSYNANPLSVTAAGEFVAGLTGDSWMVLGDMGELGDEARNMHQQLGSTLRAAGIDRLFATGDLSKATVDGFGERGQWFASMAELIDGVVCDLHADVNVLVKGSRSARMERAVEALRAPESLRREA